jgi:hypothetical protein
MRLLSDAARAFTEHGAKGARADEMIERFSDVG